MKKYNILYLLFVLIPISTVNLLAQSDGPRSYGDWLTSPRLEFYSDNTLSAVSAGKGFSGIGAMGDFSSLNLNPASVNIEKKFQVYAGYNYKTSINLYSYRLDDMSNFFPSFFAGGMYRINKDFQVGFAYRNEYSFKYTYPEYSTSEISYSLATHTFTVPVNYSYKWLRAGMNLNLTYFRGDVSGVSTETLPGGFSDAHSNLWRFIPQFGIIVTPAPFISFGATYTPAFTDSTEWYINYTSINPNYASVKYPHRFGIGTEVRLLDNRLKFTFDYHFERTSVVYQLKNKNIFNFGVEYMLENNFIIRGGFYTINDYKDLSGTTIVESDNTNWNLYFLTIGGTYKYKGLSVNLALMDAHLLNLSDAAHTKINAGIGFDF